MEINKSKVTLEMVETTTKTAEISVEEILEIVFEKLDGALDGFTIYSDPPALDYSDNGESMEVYISGVDDYIETSDIINDVEKMTNDGLEKYIKEMSEVKKEDVTTEKKAPAQKRPADYIGEEGENGTL